MLKYCFFSVALILAIPILIGLFYQVFTDEPISVSTFFQNMFKDVVGNEIFLLIQIAVLLFGIWSFGGLSGRLIIDKGKSKFKLEDSKGVKTLNVLAGGVLAVFKKGDGKHAVKTPNMTAGIRGTGVYLTHDEHDKKSYFCTCYGKTHLHTDKEEFSLEATHHNMLWVKEDGTTKPEMKMMGHSDEDLRELEAFVGRIPEFDMK